jgi:ferredoxin
MKVWIDQELCTGDALCEDLCPEMFMLADDGTAYVKSDDPEHPRIGGSGDLVAVPTALEAAVRDAADQCAGECIFIEA